jgi:hypothetical protein
LAARTFTVLGADLALTRFVGVAGQVVLDAAEQGTGLDLAVVPGGRARPSGAAATDLATVDGRANLGQALIVRLLTPRGGLAGLGHAAYGSRLGELVGRTNDTTARNLARLHVLEALGEERRVRAVTGLTVSVPPDQPGVIQISFAVLPVDDADPLVLTLEVAL